MTKDEIEEIFDAHEDEYLTAESKDPFLEGLQIISALSSKHEYAVEHDIFYASNLEDIDNLTEEIVVKLNQLGWHFEEETECFAKFI